MLRMPPARAERSMDRDSGEEARTGEPAASAPGLEDQLRDLKLRLAEVEGEYDQLRAADAALQAAHAELADRYDFAPVVFLTLDSECRIVAANLTAATMFGRERGKLVGAFLTAVVVPGQRAELRRHVQRCLTERVRVDGELSFSVRGGSSVQTNVTSTPLLDESGEAVGCRTMVSDMTAIKWSQDKLRFMTRASGRLVSSFDTTASLTDIVGFAIPDVADACLLHLAHEDGELRLIEARFSEHTPRPGLDLPLAATPSADEASALRRALRTREPQLYADLTPESFAISRWRGVHDALVMQMRPASILYVPIAARGEVFGVLTFASRSSGRRYTQGDIGTLGDLGARAAMAIENARLYTQAQRAIAARQDVLSFVSHDLKNPLMGIMLSVENMLRAAPRDDRRRSTAQLQRVMRGAQQIRRMIEDLLDMTTLESGRLKVEMGAHDLDKVLDDVVELFTPQATAAGVALELSPPQPAQVACDRQRLIQVLSNLIDNALKFTPQGGRITISGRVMAPMVLFTVADSGPGIPPAIRPHVFDRFVHGDGGRRTGRGLGLYIAKGLIEAQGGSIWVDSQEGKGTAFSFTLPIASTGEVVRSDAPPWRP